MQQAAKLVLIEDNPADVQLIHYALEQAKASVEVVHFSSGSEFLQALDHFEADGVQCILLDLNMPQLSGHEVLKRLRQHNRHHRLPVIVFTSSSDPRDLKLAYDNGANAYVRKPVEFDELCRIVRIFLEFWMGINLLP
jgi:CheY-like chemotaxis protein